MIGTLEFLAGLSSGAVVAGSLLYLTRRKRRYDMEEVQAPSILDIEFKRAGRLKYSVALLLFRPKSRNSTDFFKWLDVLSKDLRLREYDLVLQWNDDKVLLVLPGAERDDSYESLRQRFDRLLIDGEWFNISYGISFFPEDGKDIQKLILHSNNHSRRPASKLRVE